MNELFEYIKTAAIEYGYNEEMEKEAASGISKGMLLKNELRNIAKAVVGKVTGNKDAIDKAYASTRSAHISAVKAWTGERLHASPWLNGGGGRHRAIVSDTAHYYSVNPDPSGFPFNILNAIKGK